MGRLFVVVVAVLLLALACHECGPPATRDADLPPQSVGEAICPHCGGARFDVHAYTERTGRAGEERRILRYTCQACEYSWRAPALRDQRSP